MKFNLPKANLIDNIVGYFDPQAKMKRLTIRGASDSFGGGKQAYEGASKTTKSMAGWSTTVGDANADTVNDMATLRSRGRDLVRNVPIATSAAYITRSSVVGTGLKAHPSLNTEFLGMSEEQARIWERDVRFKFRAWCESKISFDAQKKQNFYDAQAMAIFNTFSSGDVFATTPRIPRVGIEQDTRIQMVEADRVQNPQGKDNSQRLTEGVETDEWGAPIAYWITQEHPNAIGDSADKKKVIRIEAFGVESGRQNVLHVFDMARPDQKRGVSWLAPIITKVKQLGRYSDAEIMAAVVSGMFTVFVKKDLEGGDILDEALSEEEDKAYPRVTGANPQGEQNTYRMGNGAMVGLAEGESVEFANPMRPNTAYEPFVTAIYREMGAALEIPYEILLKSFTSSYSASRAAFLEAWRSFKVKRVWLVRQFCQPIYEIWLSEAIAKGQVQAPGFFDSHLIKTAYCGCTWVGDSKGQIDPVKETLGMQMQEDRGYVTAEQITAELNGGDWMQNMAQRKKEQEIRVEYNLNTKPLDPKAVQDNSNAQTP